MSAADQIQKLERENVSLLLALREIVACGLNCSDALDEAEQMESIAERALASLDLDKQNNPQRFKSCLIRMKRTQTCHYPASSLYRVP